MINPPNSIRRFSRLFACAVSLSLLVPALALRAAEDEDAKTAAAGGTALFNGKDLSGWRTRDPKAKEKWKVASKVAIDESDPKKLVGTGEGGGEGAALVLEKSAGGADLISEKAFGDCEVHVEVMYPKGSNSGIYLMGQYEVQVLDSAGKSKVGPGDLGGIYNTKAPSENAAKPAGEWQTFHIVFRAPRFEGGKKTEDAKFVKVVLNGKTIHENVEAPKPTGSELPGGEKPTGPLMFQGDHGPVAFRNIRVRQTGERPAAEAAGSQDAKPAAGK